MAIAKATQEFIPIKEIREGIVILKDNSMRAILMTSSINFALQSEELQEATITQFQNFLNSLDFSVEILVQSRRLDIKPYLALLESNYKNQLNELLKIQVREYINFIRDFTDNSNIMMKHFFVVVPYASTLLSGSGSSDIKDRIIGSFSFGSKKTDGTEQKQDSFEESKVQIEQRVAVVEQGLLRSGIRCARLGSDELIEFYYKLFNPGDASQGTKEK